MAQSEALKALIAANREYFDYCRKYGVKCGATVSAYNRMKTATETAERLINSTDKR